MTRKPSRAKATLIWTITMGILLLVAYWSGIDSLQAAIQAMKDIGWLGVLWVFFAYSVVMFIRALRWKVFLEKAGETVSFWYLLKVAYVAWAQNSFLLARLGEVSRLYYLKKDHKVSIGHNTATIILEKILDVVVLAGLLGVTAWVVSIFAPIDKSIKIALLGLGVASLLGIAILILYLAYGPTFDRLFNKIPKVGELHERFYKTFSEAMRLGVAEPKTIAYTTFLTAIAWMTEAITIYLVALRFGIDAPVAGVILASLFGFATFVLPVLPGNIGAFEGVVRLVLTGFNVDGQMATRIPFVTHILIIFYLAIAGGASFLILETHGKKTRNTSIQSEILSANKNVE